MKDYLLQIKIKNAPMMNMMRANGLDTGADLSRLSNVSEGEIGLYLNLKKVPIKKSGEWRISVLKIADSLRVLPDMLFPKQHITKALQTNQVEGQVSFEDIGHLIDSCDVFVDRLSESITDEAREDALDMLDECLGTLAIREEKVLKRRFGIGIYSTPLNLDEVAQNFSISRERVRQIEKKAFRKLRDPSRMGSIKTQKS
jgi:RNA polymerase sigma factor (sigma-70 family)